MTDLKVSLNALLWGFKNLFHPRFRHYVYIPLMINCLFFGIVFYFCMHFIFAKLSFLSAHGLPSWLSWFGWIMSVIKMFVLVSAFTLLMGTFTLFATLGANLLAAPFNGLLSEACSGVLGRKLPSRPLLKTAYKTLQRELRKVLYYLPRISLLGLLCAVLYFIPLVNMAIPVLFYWFGSWMMAIQYLDYPADNVHVKFSNLLKKIKTRKTLALCFGLIVALLSSIPLINFIIMPCAVLAATKLWHEHFE